MFIIEVTTKTGKVCERFETYEEARRRVERFRPDTLVGAPFIFQELPDGSQRLVREDLKPIQWHRILDDTAPGSDEPIPLSDAPIESSSPGEPIIKILSREPRAWTWED